jgi:hypothetical protein
MNEPVFGTGLEVLLNSNQPKGSPNQELVEYAITKLTQTPVMLSFYKVRKDKNSPWHKATSKEIRSISEQYNSQAAMEIQPKAEGHTIHTHIYIVYFHTEHVFLDGQAILNWLYN